MTSMIYLAKRIVQGGAGAEPHITKAALYEAMQAGAAEIQKAGETDAQAFTRYVTTHPDGQTLMQAHSIANGTDFAPSSVQKAATPHVATGVAYDAFVKAANEMHREHPELSVAQHFAKLYEDPRSVELAKAERRENRPNVAAPQDAHVPHSRPADPPTTLSLNLLNGIAADLRAKHPELSEAQSFARVLDTPQGKKLYQRHRSEQITG
jgi:hypothetical protein